MKTGQNCGPLKGLFLECHAPVLDRRLVPYTMDLCMWRLEFPHNMAAGFPQRTKARAAAAPLRTSLADHTSHLLNAVY